MRNGPGYINLEFITYFQTNFYIFKKITTLIEFLFYFLRWRSDSAKKGREYNYEKTTKEDLNSNAMGSYNWTEIERYDATDLQLRLQDLEAFTKYEILLQAYNQFGRGPVAKIEAETLSDGNNKMKFA